MIFMFEKMNRDLITDDLLAQEEIALKRDSVLYLDCMNNKPLKGRFSEVEIRDGLILFYCVYRHIRPIVLEV